MTAPRPNPLRHEPLLVGRHRDKRAEALPRRLSAVALKETVGVLLLCGLLGFAYLGGRLLYFRRSALIFNPNTSIGTAKFKLLEAHFLDWPGGPGHCIGGTPETMLIKTDATRFEDIIAYSRRIGSPNDHDLIAVFVRDTLPGQPWKMLAEEGLPISQHRVMIPPNWLAKLHLQQYGMDGSGVHYRLMGLQGHQLWRAHASYDTDSLTESESSWYQSPRSFADNKGDKIVGKRPLSPADAAYHSPRRLRMRTSEGR